MADPITADQVLATCTEVAKANGDAFRARIGQRQGGGTFATTVATFDDVTVAHLAAPEMWLGRLLGGGQYQIQISHPNSGVASVGVILVNIGGQPRPIDVSAVDAADWAGPRTLIFPQRAAAPAAATSFNLPPGSPPDRRLAPSNQGNVGDPGGSYPAARQDPSVQSELDRLRERERVLNDQINAERARLAEERHRMEREADKREQEAREARLRAEMAAIVAANKPAAKEGPSDLAMLLVEMQKASAAQAAESRQAGERMMALIMETNKAAREAADRAAERIAATQAEAQKTSMALFQQMVTDSKGANEASAAVFAKLGEAVSGVMNMALGAVQAVQELQSGPSEPPMLTVAKEVVKGVVAYAEATKATAAAPRVTVPPRRNGAVRRPAPAQPPAQAAPPAPPPDAPAPAPAFDGVEPEDQPGEEGGDEQVPAFDQIVRAITEKRDPREIATFFVDNLDEESINDAMQAAGGNPLVAFQGALGPWVQADPENYAYVIELLKIVQEVGEAKGVVRKASPEERSAAEAAIAQMVSQPQA